MAQTTTAPLRRCRQPAYPTKLEVLADPQLLARHLPPAWLAHAELAGAVGLFLAANVAGCSNDPAAVAARRDAKLAKAAIVAPVFGHGEGRGSTGCIVLAPPAFVSEEEALQIIKEELTQSGLELTERSVQVDSATIPPRMERPAQDWVSGSQEMRPIELPLPGKPLIADLEDPKRKVAVKYISRVGYCDMGGLSSMGTVQDYEFKEVANYVTRKVKERARGVYFAAFYDPMPRSDDAGRFEWYTGATRVQRESKRLLRQQVTDFADWLKAQGVI